MPSKELSRRAYKGQLTTVKKNVEKYQLDHTKLHEDRAESDLMAQRDMVGVIESKFKGVQMEIIAESSPEEKTKEEEELLAFMDECCALEAEISRLLATITIAAKVETSPGGTVLDGSAEETSTQKLLSMMAQQLKEQKQQRLSEEFKLEKILQAQREEFKKMFENVQTPTSPIIHIAEGHAKLEPIKIPPFSGSYTEWTTFKNLFTSSVIKNSKYSKSEKMFYLRTATTGEPQALFSNLEISNENFDIAWSRLEKRYDNKTMILAAQMDKFLAQPTLTKTDVTAIRKLQSVTSQTLEAVDALGVTSRDPWLIHIALKHLDQQTQTKWSEQRPETIPTWSDFDDFLNKRCRSLEICQQTQPSPPPKSKSTKSSTYVTENRGRENCSFCKAHPHKLFKCRKFLGLLPKQRLNTVKNLKLCVNCLSEPHDIGSCAYQPCKKCNQRHNHLLHDAYNSPRNQDTPDEPTLPQRDNPTPTNPATLSCTGASGGVRPNVLFATAIVRLLGKNNHVEFCRAVLDPASQINIITTHMCQRLRLAPRRTNFVIDGVGSTTQASQQEVQMNLQLDERSSHNIEELHCIVMPKVVGDQPNFTVDLSKFAIPPHFTLADPTWYKPQKIDLLIGGGLCWSLLKSGSHSLGVGMPLLQESVLGWLIVGPCPPAHDQTHASCHVTTLTSLERTIRKFWEIEEVPKEVTTRADYKEVEDQFSATTCRNDNGRYIVQLPLNSNVPELDNNRQLAVRQLNYLSRKLAKNSKLMTDYDNIFKEYLSLGIIEKVPADELDNRAYYLPHHCVIKESALSTKVRIVFNGSSSSKSGLSINDCLKECPTVQPSLVSILWRFRLHEVVLTSDIVKMYLQVLLHPPHKDFQRFVWTEEGRIVDYRFRTVCFGVSASPYLATRVLIQLADDYEEKYPIAASILRQNFYVDDCLFSAPTVDDVVKAKQELQAILKEACMELSKFRSNRAEVFALGESQNSTDPLVLDLEAKTLGIIWNPQIDAFQFRVSINLELETWTRRLLLSLIARIFDPCGLIGPVITSAKIIIQKVWSKTNDWDKPIPDSLLVEWKSFLADLVDINQLRIPRWISTISNPNRTELHAFSDASMMAYGVSIYLVYEDSQGNRSSGLIVAKSRVTPVKDKDDDTRILTIPKAELSAAELAVQLMNVVSDALGITNIYFWTDAMVVLHWIHSQGGKKDQFVRHRVTKILKHSQPVQWRHVRTSENPADLISRGCKVNCLISSTLWFSGPEWLLQSQSIWPPVFSPTKHPILHLETVSCLAVASNTSPSLDIYEIIMARCSSFVRAIRTLAWIMRFIQLCKLKRRPRTRSTAVSIPEHLLVCEIQTAEMLLVSWDQHFHLLHVIALLKSNQPNKLKSHIRKLSPFIDGDGILRVGGRLENSQMPFDMRHPILLANGRLAEWIALKEHLRLLHAGPQLTLSSVRTKFWPIKGRNLIRSIIHRCVTCIRANPRVSEQLMGALPASRTTLVRPFLHTGIDFTGHILIKRSVRGSVSEKAYVVVFVCMSTRAVHLELITALTSAAFIATFRRFVARRGLPAHVYSDNGTNFVGGEKELRSLLRNHQVRQELADFSSNLHVQWHFNPPSAPHHGGLWEAAVKSLKTHLIRVVQNVRLTYEELNTVIVQIEAVLNSRPLIALMDDPHDPRCLTPGDFLVGNSPTLLPIDPGDLLKLDHVHRWKLCAKLHHDVSTRWRSDYLHTLQQRHKWNKEIPNIKKGDVVLLRTENVPNLEWPLGLVVEVYPGSDGKVRVAQIKARGKLFTRPITKLIKLPVDGNEA